MEVHYIGDKHGIEHEQIDKSGLMRLSYSIATGNYVVIFMAKYVGCLVGQDSTVYCNCCQDSSPSTPFQSGDLFCATGNCFKLLGVPAHVHESDSLSKGAWPIKLPTNLRLLECFHDF